MEIKRFNKKEDYERIIKFLNEQYKENKNMISWLPARFDDLIYRLDTLYHDERNEEKSSDYIFIFEDNNEIVGIIVPDGDSFNSCIKKGYESIFKKMIELSEQELLPLFKKESDGSINFTVVSHDSLDYQSDILKELGYTRDEEGDFDNVVIPKNTNYEIDLPKGFSVVDGTNIPDVVKMRTCEYGFHEELDDDNLYQDYPNGGLSFLNRKNSRYYNDSFETLVKTDDGDYCCYSFCYVDKNTNTAYIEPVSTRKKYRRMGLCKEMLHSVINRCKEMNVDRVYINAFGWRVNVYRSAGFETEDSIGFWSKKLK